MSLRCCEECGKKYKNTLDERSSVRCIDSSCACHRKQENKIGLNKHPNRKNNYLIAAMYATYSDGKSLAQIAKIYNKSRQAVYDTFRSRGYILRSKPCRELTIIDDIKWTWHSKGGMRGTLPDGRRVLLHHYLWEKQNGAIPTGMHLHFKNGDKRDCALGNLELLSIGEINKKYNPHRNQFTAANGSKIWRKGKFDRGPIYAKSKNI